MSKPTEVFVGIDVSKTRNAVAVADGQCGGEVRYLGEIDAAPEAMRRVVKRIAAKHERVHFCYEAGRPAMDCIGSSPNSAIPAWWSRPP